MCDVQMFIPVKIHVWYKYVYTCKYSARQTARRPPQNPGSPSGKCTWRRSERVTGTHGIESSHVGRTGQVVIRHGCLHHTIYIIPLCVYIYPCMSTSKHVHHTVYITPSTSHPWLSRPDLSQCLWRHSERVTSRVKERLGTWLDV